MKETLEYLYQGGRLTETDAMGILVKIGQNSFSEIEIASFLTVFLMREITPQELSGFRKALLQLCIPVDLSEFDTIDVCGTGGDGKNTFNISTLSAFVLAGAGIRVAKHGNYGVSSPVGSSNILEHFGYRFSNDANRLRREVDQAGITFLHAPLFHPAMKYVAPVRRALRTKTFFNMLGPMINPASPGFQLVGVYSEKVQDLYNLVFRETGKNYLIIHGLDGYDEISLTGKVRAVSPRGEEIISPETFGMAPVQESSLDGGNSAGEAAAIFMKVLKNEANADQQNVVLANSAAGIHTLFPEKSWSDCTGIARESLESGRALEAFKKLISLQS
ncbi:MAG: anthranilate phosphoribosyltransferase [Bacteroidota bacterium]